MNKGGAGGRGGAEWWGGGEVSVLSGLHQAASTVVFLDQAALTNPQKPGRGETHIPSHNGMAVPHETHVML